MFNLPGMTVGLTAPGGFATSFDVGVAELRWPARRSAPDTLFQIGSISKLVTALLIHQFAAEGRFGLSDPIAKLLPDGAGPQRRRNHRPAIARPSLGPARRRALVSARRPVGRLRARHPLVLFEHRLRHPRQARRTVPAASPLARQLRGPHFEAARAWSDTAATSSPTDRVRYAQGYERPNNAHPLRSRSAARPGGLGRRDLRRRQCRLDSRPT